MLLSKTDLRRRVNDNDHYDNDDYDNDNDHHHDNNDYDNDITDNHELQQLRLPHDSRATP